MPRLPRSSLTLALASLVLATTLGAFARADEPTPEDSDSIIDQERAREKRIEEASHRQAVAEKPVGMCKVDDDCAIGNICVNELCRSVRNHRRFIPPFYWHNPDARDGYRYVVPFYFDSWRHTREESYDIKVVPLLFTSRTTTPTEVSTRVWPFVFAAKYLDKGKQIGAQAAVIPLFWWQAKLGRSVGALPLLFTGWQIDRARDRYEVFAGGLAYYRRQRDDVWRVAVPLFWDHEQKGSRLATFFPVYWFRRDGLKTQSTFFPLIWHFTNGERGTDNFTFLPLFHIARQRFGRRTLVLSLLGGYEHDADLKLKQLFILTPPFFHRRDPNLSLDLAPPLFGRWSDRRTGQHGFYAGNIVHVADPDGSTTTVFPLYWRLWDRRTQRQTQLFLPIGGYHSSPGERAAVVLPAFGWRSTRGLGGWGAGVVPLFFAGRNETRRHAMLLPLFSWWKDSATGKSLTAVGPVFARVNPPTHGFDAGILPLLYFGHEDHRGYGYLAPIFWYRHTPERTTAVVATAYYDKQKNGDWAAGFAPLFYFGKHGDTRYDVALPLVYHVSTPERSTTAVLPYVHDRRGDTTTDTLFPLFYARRGPHELTIATPIGGLRERDGNGFGLIGPYVYRSNAAEHRQTHVLFPIAFFSRSPTSSFSAVLPVFWHARSGSQTDTVLFPIFWHRRGGRTDVDLFAPLFLRTKSEHALTYIVGPYFGRRVVNGWHQEGLLGLFSFGEKREGDRVARFVGGPGFFYQRNDFTGTRRLLVTGFFDTRRPDGYTSGFFPLVFAWRRGTASYALTPIFYHQADRATGLSLSVLGPFYWGHAKGATQVGIAPIFFGRYAQNGTSKTVLFPLLYFAKKEVGSTLVTPIGGYQTYAGGGRGVLGTIYARNDREYQSAAFFPLFYYSRNKLTDSRNTFVFPFYFDHDNRVDGNRVQAFTPLFWRYRTIEQTSWIGFPLYYDVHYHGESRTTAFLPVFMYHRSRATQSAWWSVPALLLWGRDRHGEDPGHDFVFFPLIWHFGHEERWTTVAFPLFLDLKRGENRTTVFLPIMGRWTRPDGDRTIVLNTYYRKGRGPAEGTWSLDVFPFVQLGRPRPQDWHWKVLEGFVGYARQGRNRTLTLLWFIDIPLKPAKAPKIVSGAPPPSRKKL